MPNNVNRIDPPSRLTIAISIILALLWSLVYLMRPAFFQALELKWTDLIVARNAEVILSDRVVIIDIDEQSLEALGQWPWPRSTLATLITKMDSMKAKAIALAFILAEPDRVSLQSGLPVQHSNNIFLSEKIDRKLSENTDTILAEALAQGPFVLGYSFTFGKERQKKGACNLHPIDIVNIEPEKVSHSLLRLYQAQGVVCNLPELSQAAPYSGFLNGQPDEDGLIRRFPLLIHHDQSVYPNLTLAALLACTDSPTAMIVDSPIGQPVLSIGEYAIPIDEKGRFWIHFAANRSKLPHIPAYKIMSGQINPAIIENCIALIGLSASGLAPTYTTPGNGRYTAVELHGQAIETIISGNHIRRNNNLVVIEIIFTLMAASLIGLCVYRFELLTVLGVILASTAAFWGSAQFLFNTRQILMSPLLPTATLTINGLLLMLYKYWNRQSKARQNLKETLVLMKSSEQNLDSIIKTIPDIVFRLDARGRITFISPAVAKYNHQPTDLIGQHILDVVSPEDRKKATYRINERRTGKRATTDLEIRLNLNGPDDQVESDLYFSVSAVGIYGAPQTNTHTFIGTQGIARDVSKRRRLEEQLKKSQKMEAMGKLAAGVAHDLNNILSGIVSYPELLLLELPKDSPMRTKIEKIQQSGKRAADIVQDLLMIARRGVKVHAPVHINQTIQNTIETLEFKQLMESNSKINIHSDLADDAMFITGSSLHISKVIMNMVRNAFEAMPTGGTIYIRTANRYLDAPLDRYECIPEGEYVVLSIIDEGIGIPNDMLQQIFEPFYSKKRMGSSGSGLGMTIVWNTLKDHCGYMDIQSREGEGTRFEVYLPAVRDADITEKNHVVLEDYIGNERILVVDDIADQRDIAVRMLSRLGYQVASVSSGETAVNHVQNHTVDLVVLDMVMPQSIDGLETYRRILESHPGQKAIIASGYSASERVKEMHKLGAGEYIRKPYTLEKIGLAVRNELDRRK